jgi:arylsulfatase A-like enzyme
MRTRIAKNALTRSVYLCTPVVLVAAIADAVGVASTVARADPWRSRFVLALELWGYVLPAVLVLGLLAALAMAILPMLGAAWKRQKLVLLDSVIDRSDVVNASAAALTAWLGGTSLFGLFLTRQYNNLDIVAFGLAAATAFALPVTAVAWVVCLWLFHRLRLSLRQRFPGAPGRWFFTPSAVIATVTIAAGALANRTTLRQLRPWFLLAPASAAVAATGLLLFFRRQSLEGKRPLVLELLGAAIATGVCVAVGTVNPELPNQWVHGDGWMGKVILVGRALTDFDRDGYSSFFGGGDCAPFDKSVHPGAVEIPGDGIDNNCVAGDAKSTVSVVKPVWYDGVPASIPRQPNLVLITVEALRADHVSFIDAKRDSTPFLRELAKDAVVFENMFSAAPITRLAIPSLLSSCYPSEIDWAPVPHKMMRHVMTSTPWLPEILQRAGYETIAVHTDFRAFTDVEPVGFDRGFSRYDTTTHLAYVGGTMHGFPSAAQIDKAEEYIAGVSGKPFFVWLHLVEPHYAYEQSPEAPNFGQDDQGLYDSELWEVDHQVGRLVGYLREHGLLDRTILFLSGDHGEEFGEHGQRWHGTNLYQPQIHPAALLYVPGLEPRRIKEATSFTDVAPMIVNLLRLKNGFGALRNRNLTPMLFGRPPDNGRLFLENFQFTDGASKNYVLGVVRWPHKLIYVEEGQTFEYYDLQRDPGEQRKLPLSGEAARSLQLELFEYLEGSARRNISAKMSAP